MIVNPGSTDVTTYFVLRTAATGVELTGATITSIDLQYTRSGVAPTAKVDATALAATDSAHGDNQAIEIDATDQPGLYRVDWPDAAFAAGVREVILSVKYATAFTEHLRVELAPSVNVAQLSGDATAADNAEAFFDGTGYAGTNNVIPTVTTTGTATAVTTVNGLAAGVITAASIAADAITDAKVAADVTIASVTGAVGSVTGNVGGNVTGSVGSVAAGGITASSIAADAIGSSELATSAVDEIVDAVWDELIAGHLTANTTGARLNAAGSAGDPWSTALPGAYADGTAGEIIGGMDGLSSSATIVFASPVAIGGNVTIYKGDGYDNDETRSLEWSTTSAATWPTLTGATITTSIEQADGTATTFTGSVVTATGATKKVRQELTAAQTAALDAGTWRLTVVATVVGTSGTVTLVDAVCNVIPAAS